MKKIRQISTAAMNKTPFAEKEVEMYPDLSRLLLRRLSKSRTRLNSKIKAIQKKIISMIQLIPGLEKHIAHIKTRAKLIMQYP